MSVFTFDAKRHLYTLDGVPVPSVTKVLGVVFSQFTSPASAAADFGSAVHAATEAEDNGEPVFNLAVAKHLGAWVRFKKESGFDPTLVEHRTYHPIYGYACTIDRLGEIHGYPWVIEIKTGQVYPEHPLQTAAQREALISRGETTLHAKRAAVYLRDDGTYRLIEHPEAQGDFETFLAALRVYRFKVKTGGIRP